MPDRIDLEQFYTATQAAEVLSKNSGKDISAAYLRQLVRYKKLTPRKISRNMSLYPKAQVDAYVVEDRGEKSARAAKSRATGRKSRKVSKQAA